MDVAAFAVILGGRGGHLPSDCTAIPAGHSSFHTTWRLQCSDQRFFLKSGKVAVLPMFEAEARDLERIRLAGAVRVPDVVAVGMHGGDAYLVLEYLDLLPLDASAGRRLGEQLAQLHAAGSDRFGAPQDNFIGTTPQLNREHQSWPYFFAQCRLRPQLELAATRGMEHALVERGLRLVERVSAFFVGVTVAPGLLHGDLWSGNAASLADGTPVIFDPASYFGDREADLAMTELFGGFPESFYVAYRHAAPPAMGYETRKQLYNLYHILNHYNLFGASYLGQARRMIDALLAETR